MSPPFRKWLCAGLMFVVVAGAVHAQNADVAPLQVQPDFSKDPCGDPTSESQFWLLIEGKVAHVVDGRTILVTLAGGHVLRVHLAGTALERQMPFPSKAKKALAEMLLDRAVGVSVSPDESWIQGDGLPEEVTAVVRLSEGALRDAAFPLLA